jgi:hypothetical protein
MQTIDPKEEQDRSKDVESLASPPKSSEGGIPESARLLSLNQAAEYTGLSYWTLRDYVLDGILPMVKLPGGRQKNRRGIVTKKAGDTSNRKILIDREDLDRLIARSKVNIG